MHRAASSWVAAHRKATTPLSLACRNQKSSRPAPTTPPCTLLLFRHIQKTGGISIRHILHRLELSRDWHNYAEGTALYMEGSRRCSPRDEAEEAVRVRMGAPLPPGCNRSFVLPLTLLEELAASCRAAASTAAAAAAATVSPTSPPPPPLRAMVELHTQGSYDEVRSTLPELEP